MVFVKISSWMILCCLLATLSSVGQNLLDELAHLYKITDLPSYRDHSRVLQISTYDTTGGNNDGFAGTYSFIRRNEDSSLVIFDAKGGGVIHRIWTPTPTEDTLDFYIDDSPQPIFSIKYTDLFSNKVFPFLSPLTDAALGGYYCYFPILFQHGCKIVCRGKKLQFHQIQYRLYPEGIVTKSFTPQLDRAETEALQQVIHLWNKEKGSLDDLLEGDRTNKLVAIADVSLQPGNSKTVFAQKKGGRIMGIKLSPASAFAGINKDIDIRITWDGAAMPAIYCPVADFFGFAFGQPSMNSLLLGTQMDQDYCYFPMPFDKEAKVELIYRKTLSKQNPVRCSVEVAYSMFPRDVEREGKFYACWKSNKLSAEDPPHILLQANGKGHYVGTLLQAQGLKPGMTSFFEGDDSVAIDGVPCIHGTGSEDYFNGGWYACPDRWDTRMSLPIHGALDYSLPQCRTGGYRFYLSDKIPFSKSIFQSIEHGLGARGFPVDYTSVSFYYCDSAAIRQQKPANELCRVYLPDTLMLYPQMMQYNVWGSVAMQAVYGNFNIGGSSCIYGVNDESRIKIFLSQIPAGEYQLFMDLVKFPRGCRFSVCQGQTNKTDWVDTYSNEDLRVEKMYVCDVQVNELQNSLTFDFNTSQDREKLFLNRLILVKKK